MWMFGQFYSTGQKVLDKEGDLGEVWISGYEFAHNLQQLKSKGIFGVCSGVQLKFQYPAQFKHLVFDLDDDHKQQVGHTFKPAYEFIEQTRKQTNVLVHCAAGISRCSTLLIAYMMQKYRLSFDQCLKKIQSARECCQPNMGFVKQLRKFEKQLGIGAKDSLMN